jgi:hypothetical protein
MESVESTVVKARQEPPNRNTHLALEENDGLKNQILLDEMIPAFAVQVANTRIVV